MKIHFIMEKTLKFLIIIGIGLLTLTACGGGGDEGGSDPIDDNPSGKSYTTELEMPAQASEKTYNLEKLTGTISNVQSSESWLTAAKATGALQIKARWTENTANHVRKCVVNVTTTTKDKMAISVTQKTKDVDTDAHDTKSDQPAYSKSR